MNEAEKERLIKKDIVSIENRVRHAFNQGYEMGMKESRSEIPNTCGDAISREHLLEEIAMLKKSPWFNENTYGSKVIRKEAVEIVEDVCIKREPSVTPKQKTGRWIIKDGKEQGYDIAGVKTWYIQIMCDKCGFIKTAIEGHIGEYKFCPKCGQPKMQEVDS